MNGIGLTEDGVATGAPIVWTGTDPDGTLAAAGDHCLDWASAGGGPGVFGTAAVTTDPLWSDTNSTVCLLTIGALYCFEQAGTPVPTAPPAVLAALLALLLTMGAAYLYRRREQGAS